MSLAAIYDAANIINAKNYPFTDEERDFIVKFAFKTNSREKTGRLVEELMSKNDDDDSKKIIANYSHEYGVKPYLEEQVENLLIALEMYRIELEKSTVRLSEVLGNYNVDITPDEIKELEIGELKTKVKNKMEAR